MKVAPNDQGCDDGKYQTHREAGLHPGVEPERDDQPTADRWGDHNRYALEQRLDAEADAAAIVGQMIGDDGEYRGQREVAPRHDRNRADEKPRPTGTAEVNRVTDRRDEREGGQGLSPAEMIRDPTAGKGQDGFEQIFECAIKGDDGDAAPEHLQILGRESRPKFFADTD
jgi:hypothetical protein